MKNRTKTPHIPLGKASQDYQKGRALRKQCPRSSQGQLILDHRDPVALHLHRTRGRIPELIPIRFQRILESPFAHFRGSVSLMAYDLSKQPRSGIDLQLCGDCHLQNFGGFATPERRIIFDLNDFDETLLGPWEWDLKRLATSLAIASDELEYDTTARDRLIDAAVGNYIFHTRRYAGMSALQVWYEDIRFEQMIESQDDGLYKKVEKKKLEKKLERTPHEREFSKMVEVADGVPRLIDNSPLLYHLEGNAQDAFLMRAQDAFERYRDSLPDDKKVLLQHYHIKDVAIKVVGVSSVGTWCGIVLLMSESGDPLFLQFKEAHPSVLEPYTAPSKYEDQGQRVVEGQKIMQSASDIFLGWATDASGRSYYIRQLRDATIKPDYKTMDEPGLLNYARFCGHALAQAHARSGKSALVSGYIGKSGKFLAAVRKFAHQYTLQNQLDFEKLQSAVAERSLHLGN